MSILSNHSRQRLRERSLVALTIICLPCICVVGTCVLISHCVYSLSAYELPSTRRRKRLEWEEREKQRHAPFILPPREERDADALTICDDEESSDILVHGCEDREDGEGQLVKGKKEQKAEWQDQSPLFNLPLEVRRMIYEEVLAGYTFHVFALDYHRRIAHARCKTAFHGTCQCTWLSRQPGVADEWGNTSLLHFLGTCRRIYTEAIDILYAKNTFTFASIPVLISHLLNIPEQRIEVMRDVRWRVYISAEEWSSEMPWLECRKMVLGDGPGCVCYKCWPKEIAKDTRSHDWLRYCWLVRMMENERFPHPIFLYEALAPVTGSRRCNLNRNRLFHRR